VVPNVMYSTPMAMRLPMRWVAILFERLGADLAATSGIHRGTDAIKMIMAGASVTMLCSCLLRHGIKHLRVIEQELRDWMTEHEYSSIQQMKGSLSQKYCADPGCLRARPIHPRRRRPHPQGRSLKKGRRPAAPAGKAPTVSAQSKGARVRGGRRGFLECDDAVARRRFGTARRGGVWCGGAGCGRGRVWGKRRRGRRSP
jgi:hypothetical protein